MSNQAYGIECPRCHSLGTHNVTAYVYADHTLVGVVLHCLTCENVWEEMNG